MNEPDRTDLALHAYCDGELGWFARSRFEAQLRGSPELRRRVEEIRALGPLVRDSESPHTAPDLWSGIAPRLAGLDAELAIDTESPSAPVRSGSVGWTGWRPLGATLAAAAALALAVLLTRPVAVPDEVPLAAGVVRFLDTNGEPVMVQDEEGMTIIWLMDALVDEV